MKPFTVIGYYEESGQIFSDHVLADTAGGAFAASAAERPDACYVCAMPGHLFEGNHVEFPGDGVVDGATILEQTDVFADA